MLFHNSGSVRLLDCFCSPCVPCDPVSPSCGLFNCDAGVSRSFPNYPVFISPSPFS